MPGAGSLRGRRRRAGRTGGGTLWSGATRMSVSRASKPTVLARRSPTAPTSPRRTNRPDNRAASAAPVAAGLGPGGSTTVDERQTLECQGATRTLLPSSPPASSLVMHHTAREVRIAVLRSAPQSYWPPAGASYAPGSRDVACEARSRAGDCQRSVGIRETRDLSLPVTACGWHSGCTTVAHGLVELVRRARRNLRDPA
jgi:hypothetical protein